MNANTAMKELFVIFKKSEKQIAKLRENKDLENPVQIDFVKTEKSMTYEDALVIIKQFAAEQRRK